MAICEATVTGWLFGRLTVPVPRRIRFTAPASEAMNIVQEVMFSAKSVACSPT